MFENDKAVQTEREILMLADNMAAAAASFSAHGYDQFIRSRNELIDGIRKIVRIVYID